MRRARFILAFIVLATAGVMALPQRGGGGGADAWMQLTMVHVNPAQIDEYLGVQREITAKIRRGGPAWRMVSRTEPFGDAFQFLILTPLQNVASAEPRPDPELTALNARAAKYIVSQNSYGIRNLTEIDNPLPARQAPDFMMINIVHVAPGKDQDYYNLMKTDFLPHFTKANMAHVSGSLVFGGETGYFHQFYLPNLAALDQGSPVVKALGAAGAQAVTAKFAGIVTSQVQLTSKLVPELSFGPWAPGSGQRP